MFEIILADSEALLQRCRKIRHEVFVTERGVDPAVEQDGHDVLGGVCGHFLITKDGCDVGALRCLYEDGIVKLQRMCVLKEHRKSGAGAAAIRFVERYYLSCGAGEIRLDSKCEAEGFYEKLGYRAVSERFIEAGIPHVKMLKELRGYI